MRARARESVGKMSGNLRAAATRGRITRRLRAWITRALGRGSGGDGEERDGVTGVGVGVGVGVGGVDDGELDGVDAFGGLARPANGEGEIADGTQDGVDGVSNPRQSAETGD